VASLCLADLRRGGADWVADRLADLAPKARYVVANAEFASDLETLALGIELAERRGLRLVYRTGPSFVSARAGERPADPLRPDELGVTDRRGLVVVGSHTELTSKQLEEARARHRLGVVMLDVEEVLSRKDDAVSRAIASLQAELARGDAALVTSRKLVRGRGGGLEIGARVSGALVEIVSAVVDVAALGWVVAKGGITSHDMAVRALGARRVTVLGQLFRGQISVWELGEGSRRPGLRYVVFPGNVGDRRSLAEALDRLGGVA
jgi:uncharacterized protein YgbK (DUF1537 family)